MVSDDIYAELKKDRDFWQRRAGDLQSKTSWLERILADERRVKLRLSPKAQAERAFRGGGS